MNKHINSNERHTCLSFTVQELQEQKPKSFFKRFFNAIRTSCKEVKTKNLKGKIQEFQKHSTLMIEQLHSVKNALEKQIENDVFKHVKDAIDPMIRDLKQLQMKTQQVKDENDCPAKQKYETFKHKAKLWLDLQNKSRNRSDVIEVICNHLFKETEEQIEKDLNFIENYKETLLNPLKISSEEKENLKERIHKKLMLHTSKLTKLKMRPETMDLQDITLWKANTIEKRSFHFTKALKAIDGVLHINDE